MTEDNTDLNSQVALVIPNGFIIGEAAGGGDCFFDSVAQGMNALCIAGGPFDVNSLRQACCDYAKVHEDSVYDSRSGKTWHQIIAEDAVAGGYASGRRHEHVHFESYLAHIRLTAAERAVLNLGAAIWGRPEIEGRMLCEKYGIKLHLIEKHNSGSQEVIVHQLVDSSGSRSMDENASLYIDPQIIHILNEGLCHFVPILHKTSVPNKPVQKQTHLLPSEGVQSQNNPTDGLALHPVKSVAASPNQVSLLVAQPEQLERGPEKSGSASEVKTHRTVNSHCLKECSLTDKSTWSAVAAKKEDADFKILRITNSPTVSAALDFMQTAEFYETFNQASHWFFIVLEVDNCSEFPSKAVDCLAEVLDEQKPVIIQWDIMHTAEHLVFFKKTGHCAFTPLHMNSVSLFSTVDELILQLSKQGSFQLPLLLNALQLGIGGQFKGGALDLLNVSFDVNQEIDTWRLIDYAARDDDSLSIRFLLLFDWDLAYKNGEGRRTLEIAAEYGGPQSLSALLNLPITSSAEEHFLSNKEKELLTLRNDDGDSPLLIAAEKGRPDTLQFLIHCGADILCHRRGNEKVTAIKLAWDKDHYESVCVLLEADSPFPDEIDLSDVEYGENTAPLLKQVEDRQNFHQAITEGLQVTLKEFIESHPRLKCAYDPSNQCALMTALKAGQYELYALLQSEGYSAGTNDQLSVVLEGLTREDRERLKRSKLKYFGKQVDSHIIYLLSKSRLGFGQENKKDFGIIRELYKQLDTIPEISTVLKVVEQSEVCEIIFDFGRDSIVDLDPTQSSTTSGVCDYRAGRIYVGAKEQSELLGTLAHELTHLAMQVCYDNECNPYEEADERAKSDFDEIVSHYHKKKGMNSIIKRVFTVYGESSWPSELIVRVPHLLAYYSREQDRQLVTHQAPKLFQFYEQHTQENLRQFIEDPACIKARHQIQRLNKLLEKMNEIKQSKIWLNDECLLNDDVINCQTIQILSSSLPRLTILNLYQVVRRKRLSIPDMKSGYILVSSEQFKNREKAEAIYLAFQSVTHPTLIIDCSYDYDRSVADMLATVNSFSEKRGIILIAVPDVAQSLQGKLRKYQAKVMHGREYTWSDLTPESQKELLKSTVCFQGSSVSLNELISAVSPITNFLPLADLLEKKTLEIGKPVLTSTTDGCIENYYIDRSFNHQVVIKKDIFEKKFCADLLATTEQEFRKFCQDNSEKNVHWLLEDESGRLIWHQSKGSLMALREYIDKQNPLPYLPENLDKFLEQAQRQKVMLIADTAGMGKTTVLTQLSKQIKQKFPTYWVVKIDLNDHTDVFEAQMKQKIETNEFLCEKLLKLHKLFEKELFKQCCLGTEEATKVVLMFDGFDEISPKYKNTVLDLLQDLNPLKQPWIEQLWVTTRPHLREELEDKLQQLCYTLEPFSKDNQIGFLTKFWHQHLKLEEGNQQQLEIYARALIENLAQSISDKEKEFTGIPLQTRMLAEAFEKEVKNYCLSQKSEPELPKQLSLVDLYRKSIKEKLNIFKTKGEIAEEQHTDIIMCDISITKNHQKWALEVLCPEMKDTVLQIEECDMLAPEAISRIGIVQFVNNKPHFIHRTFAEYYVADFLVTHLTKQTCFLFEVLYILYQILLGADYEVTRFFLDGLLVNLEKSKVIYQYGEQIYKVWREKCVSVLHKGGKRLIRGELEIIIFQAVEEDNAHIIDFFFTSLKAAGHSDGVKKLLLHQDSYRGFAKENAWHMAASIGHIKTLETLWGWGREVQVNLKDDLLLYRTMCGKTAVQLATGNGSAERFDKLWDWCREWQLNLNNDLFLPRGCIGQTAWDIAVRIGNREILEKLWIWGREVHVNLKDDLLLAKGRNGQTAWNIAVQEGNKEILEKLWCWGREAQANLKDDMLLAYVYCEQTAWDIAAEKGNKEILEKLWIWGREVHVNLKDDLLLAKGRNGQTAWNIAVQEGNKEILEKLWCWGREAQANLKDDMLLAYVYCEQTAWDIAAKKGNMVILEKLWGWGREIQLNLKYELLLYKPRYGQTAFNIAAEKGNKEILEKLWCWGREVQVNLKDDLLLAKDVSGDTAWHIAARCDNKDILEKLWIWGREVQVNLKNDLLLMKGRNGQSAWNIAVEIGNKKILENLWLWGREVHLNLQEDLLLAKSKNGQTAWNIAAQEGNKEILEKLWGLGREVQANLKDDLLLSKGRNGLTAWDMATLYCKNEILEKLWGWGREAQVNLKDDLLLTKVYYEHTAWDIAAKKGNIVILEKLWGWGREIQLNLKGDLLLYKPRCGQTAFNIAAEKGNIEILEKLWGWGREVQVNLKDDLLLAKDVSGDTAWHIAARCDNKQILDKLWGWGREVQLNLKDDLLLAKGRNGQSAWNIAAEKGNEEILEKLWCWGREVRVNLKDDLLLAKGRNGQTAWNIAAQEGNKILEKLWGWGREVHANLQDDLLLTKGENGLTAWDMAALYCRNEILEKLWAWGREAKVNLKDDMLLAKVYYEQAAWDIAAKEGSIVILEKLWGWGREIQLNLKDDLLLYKPRYGQTAFNIAAEKGNKEVLEKLWGWGREVQVNLKDDLLLAQDVSGDTAWHIAARCDKKEILEKLWGWGREVQVNLKDDLLLAKGRNGQNAWNIAAEKSNKVILEKLWCWGRQVQVNLKDDLLLAKDVSGDTAWHVAARYDDKEILEELWCWGREVQVNLKDDLLLSKGNNGLTAWDVAALRDKKKLLEKLWGWGREVQVNLKNTCCYPKVWLEELLRT